MSIAKKHHYVPQGYLRNFSNKKNKDFIITVYDKISNKFYESNIKNIAEEKNYNRIKIENNILLPPNNDELYYEKKYISLIEGELPKIIQNTIAICTMSNHNSNILNNKLKNQLSKIIIIQLLRTRNARDFFHIIGEKCYNETLAITKKYLQENLGKKSEIYIKQLNQLNFSDNFMKSILLNHITDEKVIEKYCNYLTNNHSWYIFENPYWKYNPFVTSDTPVILSSLDGKQVGLGKNGINRLSTAIIFPISSRYILCLYHNKNMFFKTPNIYEDKCTIIYELNFINTINGKQLVQCTRQVYFKPLW